MPIKILLVDDSATAQSMGKNILSDAGYEVLTLSQAAEVMTELPEFEPDVVILDIYMHGVAAGLALCEELRRNAATESVPVLLAVGKMEPFRAEQVDDVRADGVIVKPFEATELIAKVRQTVALAAARPRADYRALRNGRMTSSQNSVLQLWPAAAIAKITGVSAGDSYARAASASNSAARVGHTEARHSAETAARPSEAGHIGAAVQRVLARALPDLVSEILKELDKVRGKV